MIPIRAVLVIAVILGLLFPGPGAMAKDILIPVLAICMFFSLLSSDQSFKFDWQPIKVGITYNYLIQSSILIIFALFLPTAIKDGIVLYALFPPAITVMVLSHAWGGNSKGVFIFQILSYTLSMVFIPIAAYLLLGYSVDSLMLIKYLVFVFGIPAVLSLVIGHYRPNRNKAFMEDLSDLMLGLVFYIVIASAQSGIMASAADLLVYAVLLFIVAFGISFATAKATKNNPDAVLYSFMKNGAAAAAIATALALPVASILIISTKIFYDVIFIILFGSIMGKK